VVRRTGHADCDYWHLTPYQCQRYHLRLSCWYADRSRQFSDKATRLAHQAITLALVALGFLLLDLMAQVMAAVVAS
jgi:hypothetical protein